jgi:hypothetical protein
MLADLNYTARSLIVPETLEMDNENRTNRWKRLDEADEHLLARIRVTRAG